MKILKTPPTLAQLLNDHSIIRLVAFDMDGTLLNTEYLHAMAHVEIMNMYMPGQKNYTWQKFLEQFKGIDDPTVFKYLQENKFIDQVWNFEEFQKRKDGFFEKKLKTCAIDDIFDPRLKKLIIEIQNKNIKLALVTSSERPLCYFLLNHFKLRQRFDLITTRNDVTNFKPNPEPYLKTFNLLEVHASDVIVFEDSNVGTKSALDSGANTYKVQWYDK